MGIMNSHSYKKVSKMEWLKKIDLFSLIVGLYALSTLLLSTVPFKSWETLGLGLFLAAAGSLASLLLFRQGQKTDRQPVLNHVTTASFSQPPVSASLERELQETKETLVRFHEREEQLVDELNIKKSALQLLEKEKNAQSLHIEEISRELAGFKQNTEEELRRKQVLLEEYQETINQQRDVITKKQDQITELEAKVHDLNYEVKTLLQLAEIANKQDPAQDSAHEPAPEERPAGITAHKMIRTTEEASEHLKRCLDIAQKITSANRFGNGMNSRFKDLSIDHRALDLRRLFDNLRSENSAAIFVFSQKENTPLFANAQMTELLGWPTEKFIQQFSEIISESTQEWKKGLSVLANAPEAKVRLLLKTRAGKNLLLHCHLGIIATGAFRNHIIGVLYSA